MRSLLLLQWCFAFLFACYASDSPSPRTLPTADCNWELPTKFDECKQIIRWKVHDERQATATCMEYFATTFIEGIIDPADEKQIICIVSRQYQCDYLNYPAGHPKEFPKAVPMFDKCYKFYPEEVTMKTVYATFSCNHEEDFVGSEPVFLTMTQSKHIAMKAHKEGISKMWVNGIHTSEGGAVNLIPAYGHSLMLYYKKPFKLHEAHYWLGEELKETPKINGEFVVPIELEDLGIDRLLFRTKNDPWNNLFQGSFERAGEISKASLVCEYAAKPVLDQKKYCEKLTKMNINSIYDETNGHNKRCLYTTLTQYSLRGTPDALTKFAGCRENPSKFYKWESARELYTNSISSGPDDGTASKEVYEKLTEKGTYRIAAIKEDTSKATGVSESYKKSLRTHCDKRPFSAEDFLNQRSPFRTYDHFMKKDFSIKLTSPWENGYPKDECSDFPEGEMNSNTLAIRKGKIIDVPVPARFPVICSIVTKVDCSLNQNVCPTNKVCRDVDEWNKDTKLYATCECARFHDKDDNCGWNGPATSCAMMHRYGDPDSEWKEFPKTWWHDLSHVVDSRGNSYNDAINKIVVRHGCKMSLYSHPVDNDWNFELVADAGYGEHRVPHNKENTLNGWTTEMLASAAKCHCS